MRIRIHTAAVNGRNGSKAITTGQCWRSCNSREVSRELGSPNKLAEPRTIDVDGRELTFTRDGDSVVIKDGHRTISVRIDPGVQLSNQQLRKMARFVLSGSAPATFERITQTNDLLPRRVSPHVKFPLYKFIDKRWKDRFFDHGELRLGTIYDYRDQELHAEGVHDAEEGLGFFGFPWVDLESGLVVAGQAAMAFNNLVYCTTDTYDPASHRFGDDCFRIDDVRFFDAISDQLQDFQGVFLRHVWYVPDRRFLPDVNFVGIIKPVAYAGDNEVRACWEPRTVQAMKGTLSTQEMLSEFERHFARLQREALQVTNIRVPEAVQFCTRNPTQAIQEVRDRSPKPND